MPKTYTSVRIERETHARLEAFRRHLLNQVCTGRLAGPDNDRVEFSIDGLIRELLDRDEAHRERGRASSKRRARKNALQVNRAEGQGE